jgi:hypothetical protein
MTRSRLVFGKVSDSKYPWIELIVHSDPETVVDTLKNGWGQLNQAEEGEEPNWVWVNRDRVLYVERVSDEPLPPLAA